MHRRAAALIIALVSLVLVVPVAPAGRAEALVGPGAGWVHEVDSAFGEGVLAGTADGLLIARPQYRAVQRWVFGAEPTLIATDIAARDVAWDPTTDDAVVAIDDGRVVRIDGAGERTTVATISGTFGVDVDDAGRMYVAHVVPGGATVTRIDRDGTQRDVAHADQSVFAFAVAPDGDVLLGEANGVVRFSDGVGSTILGTLGTYCFPPSPCGDEGPARQAKVSLVNALDVGADGSIYLADRDSERVRVIRPDGIVHNLVGSFTACMKVQRSDCLPSYGPRTAIQHPLSIAYVEDDLLVIDQDDARRWTRLLQVVDVDRAPAVMPQGYRMIAADGGVFAFGWAAFRGSTGDIELASPIVAGRSNGDAGYWFVAGDGGVFTFGDAGFFGSAAGATSSPVVDMAVRADGTGYWVLERNGAVHAFGSAPFCGHARLLGPFTAIIDSPEGLGYALVAEDGRQYGLCRRPGGPVQDLPGLNAPLVAAHRTASGEGLWMVAADGGVFTQGDAGFFGSTGAMRLNQPVLDLIPTPTEQGYWLIAADGGVFTFGDAEFMGSMGAVRLNRPVVAGMAGPR